MAYRSFGADLGGFPAKNAADGVAATDLATVGQVTAARQGYDLKDPVRVVSVSNITLSGTQTIDGVALAVGDSVLVAGQTTQSANGVYLVASGAWTRRTDADENAEVTPGFSVAVLQGTQKGTGAAQSNVIRWSLTNITNPTINTTALTFAPEGSSGSAAPTSGSGAISVAGTAVSFVPKSGGGILQDGSGAYIDSTSPYARRPSYSADIPATTAGTNVQMTHGLNTLDGVWRVYAKATFNGIPANCNVDLPDVTADANSVTFQCPIAIPANTLRFVFIPA